MPLTPGEFADVVEVYEQEIDGLIESMGKDCLLVFKESVVPPDDPSVDPIYGNSKFDDYKFSPPIDNLVRTENTKIIKALITHNPSDFVSFVGKVYEPSDLLRLKTYARYVPDLRRCDYIIPDINVKDAFGHKYRLIRDLIPRGMVNNRYTLGYFARVD